MKIRTYTRNDEEDYSATQLPSRSGSSEALLGLSDFGPCSCIISAYVQTEAKISSASVRTPVQRFLKVPTYSLGARVGRRITVYTFNDISAYIATSSK